MVGEDDFVRTDGSVLEIVERPAEGQQASALKYASKRKVKHETWRERVGFMCVKGNLIWPKFVKWFAHLLCKHWLPLLAKGSHQKSRWNNAVEGASYFEGKSQKIMFWATEENGSACRIKRLGIFWIRINHL